MKLFISMSSTIFILAVFSGMPAGSANPAWPEEVPCMDEGAVTVPYLVECVPTYALVEAAQTSTEECFGVIETPTGGVIVAPQAMCSSAYVYQSVDNWSACGTDPIDRHQCVYHAGGGSGRGYQVEGTAVVEKMTYRGADGRPETCDWDADLLGWAGCSIHFDTYNEPKPIGVASVIAVKSWSQSAGFWEAPSVYAKSVYVPGS